MYSNKPITYKMVPVSGGQQWEESSPSQGKTNKLGREAARRGSSGTKQKEANALLQVPAWYWGDHRDILECCDGQR